MATLTAALIRAEAAKADAEACSHCMIWIHFWGFTNMRGPLK